MIRWAEQTSASSNRMETLEARQLFSVSWDVVLLDSSLADQEQLAAAVAEADHLLVYDSATQTAADVLEDVTQWAQAEDVEIDTISIFSHGSEGAFSLGSDTVDAESLSEDDQAWRDLADVLDDDADLNLFACNVASGTDGLELLDALAGATGADVFASDDVTGAGGDWDLEAASTGSEAELAEEGVDAPLDFAALDGYAHSLADYSDAAFTGTQTFVADSQTFTLSVSGAGTINFDYDDTTDTLQILGTSGTDGTTAISISDDDGTADLNFSNLSLDGDAGSITSNVTIGQLDLNATLSSDLAVDADVGTLLTATVNGSISITGDLDWATVSSMGAGASLTADQVTGSFHLEEIIPTIYSGTFDNPHAISYVDGEFTAAESMDFEDYSTGGVDGVDGWTRESQWNSGGGYTGSDYLGVTDLGSDQVLELTHDETAGLHRDVATGMDYYEITWNWQATDANVNQVLGLMNLDASPGWGDFAMRIILNDDGNVWLRGDSWINTGIVYGTGEHSCKLVLDNAGAASTWDFYWDGELVEADINTSIDLSAYPVDTFAMRANTAGGQYVDDLNITGFVGGTPPNNAPTVHGDTFAVDETAANGTSVGTVSGADGDPGDSVTFAITAGNDDGVFDIDTSTGEITIADDSNLDYESTMQYSLTVRVTDNDGLTDDATVTIDITDAIDTPTLVNNETVYVAFGGSQFISDTQLLARDDNSSLTYHVTAGPSHGTLWVGGVALEVGDSFTGDQLNDGMVSYVHAGGDHTDDSYTIEVREDNGSETLTIVQNVSVEDSLAEFDFQADGSATGGLTELTVSELAGTSVNADFNVTEPGALYWDSGEATLNESSYFEFTVSSDAGLNLGYQQMSLWIENAAMGRGGTIYLRTSQDGFTGNVDSILVDEGGNRLSLYTFDLSSLGAEAGTSFRLYLTKEGSSNPGLGSRVNIHEMGLVGNLFPHALSDTASVTEGQSVTIDVASNDSDTSGETLSIQGFTNASHGSVSLSGGQIIYTASTGWSGTDTFTYTVTDGRGGSDTQTVSVSVQAAPEDPPPLEPEPDSQTDPIVPEPDPGTGFDSGDDGGSDFGGEIGGDSGSEDYSEPSTPSMPDPIIPDSPSDPDLGDPGQQSPETGGDELDGDGSGSDAGGEDLAGGEDDFGDDLGDELSEEDLADAGEEAGEGNADDQGGQESEAEQAVASRDDSDKGRSRSKSDASGDQAEFDRHSGDLGEVHDAKAVTASTGGAAAGQAQRVPQAARTMNPEAAVARYDRAFELESARQWEQLQASNILKSLDRLQDQANQQGQESHVEAKIAVGTTAGVTVMVSASYLLWCTNGGSLMASMLTSVPLWCKYDPVPILDLADKAKAMKKQRKGWFSKAGKSSAETDSEEELNFLWK